MIIYILFCVFITVKLRLLTYQDIGTQLDTIHTLFNEKQNQWFERNRNNELIIIEDIKDTNFAELIKPMIDKYISNTEDTNIYLVSVSFLIDEYNKNKFSTYGFAKYANEIIQKCARKYELDYKLEKYGLIWECKKYNKNNVKEILKQIKSADMLYIDGFYAENSSFDEFVRHYLRDMSTLKGKEFKVIVNLQKKENDIETYIDLNIIINELKFDNNTKKAYKMVKFNNKIGRAMLETINPDFIVYIVVGDCYTVNLVENKTVQKKDRYIWNDFFNFSNFSTIIGRDTYTRDEQPILDRMKNDYFYSLSYKIIHCDEIRIVTDKIYEYEIHFYTFLNEQKIDLVGIKYDEIVIIVMINFHYHYIIKYHVQNVNGILLPITYDEENSYYKKLKSQHKIVQTMLEGLQKVLFNVCKIEDEQFLELYTILYLKYTEIMTYSRYTYKIQLKNIEKSYHKKNIKFIKNLKMKFGKNIDIKLYNVSYDLENCIPTYSDKWFNNLQRKYVFLNKINTDKYITDDHNNLTLVFMALVDIQDDRKDEEHTTLSMKIL